MKTRSVSHFRPLKFLASKTKSLIILLSLLPTISLAQLSPLIFKPPPESLSISPSSIPSAFTLLGVNAESIKRPGTTNELVAYIRTVTEDFAVMPRDLAVELYPYWLWKGKDISFDEYADSTIGATFKQTLSFSVATSFGDENASDSSSISMAVGTDFSVSRGKVDLLFRDYEKNLDSLRKLLTTRSERRGKVLDSLLEKDSVYLHLEKQIDNTSYQDLRWVEIKNQMNAIEERYERQAEEILAKEDSKLLDDIHEISSSLYLRRIGFKWDLAGGVAIISPQGGWSDIGLRGGAWTTFGYEWRNWGGMIVARGLLDQLDSTEVSIDVGFKAFFDKPRRPFSFSGELLYHRPLSEKRDNDRLRAIFSADYRLGNAAVISLAAGNEFGPDVGKPIAYFKILLGNDLKIPFPTLESKND